MLHSTQTTKKHIGNLILRFGMAGLLAAGLFFSAPYSAAAETVPSAENTDAGEITIHFTHHVKQGGLAAAGGSHNGHKFAVIYREVHAVKGAGDIRLCAVILFQVDSL